MTPFALIPVKPPAEAKSRLRGVLSDGGRTDLAWHLFDHVATVTTQAIGAGNVIVISRDAAVLDIAAKKGTNAVREPEGGSLNAALESGRSEAVRRGADAILALPGDLPFLSADDIAVMIAAAAAPAVVIAPDRHGLGTNALLLAPPGLVSFAFGDGSFSAHLSAARRCGAKPVIVRRPGLAFDVDTEEDYAMLRRRQKNQPAG